MKVPIDAFRSPYGEQLADLVAASGGILGGVTRAVGGVHGRLIEDIDPLLDTLLRLASERSLDVDLHVDESGDPASACFVHSSCRSLTSSAINPSPKVPSAMQRAGCGIQAHIGG
jgi:hypothetical protein